MNEIDYATLSARDLAGLIGSHLAAQGIDVTLVGETSVSIYSDNLYQSDDLDFVDRSYTPSKHLKTAMHVSAASQYPTSRSGVTIMPRVKISVREGHEYQSDR